MPHMTDPNSASPGQLKDSKEDHSEGGGHYPSPNRLGLGLQPGNVQSHYATSPRHLSPGSSSMAGLVTQTSPNVYAQFNMSPASNGPSSAAAIAAAAAAQQRANAHRMAMQHLPATSVHPQFSLNPVGQRQQQNYSEIMKSAANNLQGRGAPPNSVPLSAASPNSMQAGSSTSAYRMASLHPPMPSPKSHHPYPSQMVMATSTAESPNVKTSGNSAIASSISGNSTKQHNDARQTLSASNIPKGGPSWMGSQLSPPPLKAGTNTSIGPADAKPPTAVAGPPHPGVSSPVKGDPSFAQLSWENPPSNVNQSVKQSPVSNNLKSQQTVGYSPNAAAAANPTPGGLILRSPPVSAAKTSVPSKTNSNSSVGSASKLIVGEKEKGPNTPTTSGVEGKATSIAPKPTNLSVERGPVLYRRDINPLLVPAKAEIKTPGQQTTGASLPPRTPERALADPALYKSSPKPFVLSTLISPKPPSKLRGGHYAKPGSSSSSAPFGYPKLKITADQIMEAMPENASSIFHIMDRRINFDAHPPDASFYSLLRSWVQDDPYRKIPPSGSNLLEYADLPSERRVEEEDAGQSVKNRKRKLEVCDVLSKTVHTPRPSIYSLRSTMISRAKRIKEQKRKERREKDAASIERLKRLGVTLPQRKR